MSTSNNPIAITTLDLRNNIPNVRKGINQGRKYILLYRGRPIAEIVEVSKATQKMFFAGKTSAAKNQGAMRLKRNSQHRRKERLQKLYE